jgi:PAS domain S-box-containing protein
MKFPIFDQGKLIATANISTDITGEKEYNKILEQKIKEEIQKKEENESFYNQIFQTANLGICLTNLEGRFVAVNPQYCNIYGYTQEELIGKHFTIVVPDEYKQTLAKLHDQFLKEKKGELAKEWEVVRKDGERIYILASASILENVIGGPYKITTISDVTEARKTRELQQRQEAMLIQQSKMAAMGEMLGAIAHQWRQPLNVINCTTLDMKLKKEMGLLDDRTFESSIHDLENLTQEMSRTIEDFMNFFKVDKKIVEIDINECFSYALKIFEAQFKNNGIEVLIDIDKNIKICGIMGELEQVFLNLLSNAKDAFLTSDKEEKRVKIYTQRKDGAICIIFEDNAQGIEEEKISKIFDPYFTTKKGGTGIGLYMSSLIISNTFGGKIYAQNIYKQGKPEGLKIICEIKKDQKC